MSTTAKALLEIMSVRLGTQEAGTIKLHSSVRAATLQLVERLRLIPPDENIDISYVVAPLHAKYIRTHTGELLAEIKEAAST